MPDLKREVGTTLDIHVHTPAGSSHVLTVHRTDKDEGPLQLVSTERMAQLLQVEAMMERMLGELASDALAEAE